MKKIYIILSVILIAVSSVASYGQNLTSYFVKNSTLRHNLNPALTPEQGYVGFPILSNIKLDVNSNLGASSIFFPLSNGKVGLFLNQEVNADEFLNALPETSYLDAGLNLDIINAGWRSGQHSFWTLDFGIKDDLTSTLPKELFTFLKKGMQTDPQSYLIQDFTVSELLYSQVAVGYSHNLDRFVKGLRVGGKVKLLFGIANMSASVNQLSLQLSSSNWKASSYAEGYVLGGGFILGEDEKGIVNNVTFQPKNLGLAGIGAGVDFGVEYTLSEGTPVDGLSFSLSVVDLGFISYFQKTATKLESNGNVSYSGFQDIDITNMNIDQDLDKLKEELMSLASFKSSPCEKSITQMISTKLYAGVSYSFFKDQMNVGLLYFGKWTKYRYENELTLSYNYSPVHWFDVALSYSFLNSRQSIGWLLTFAPKRGLNFFIGSDYTCLKYTPQGIPVKKTYLDVNLGISIPLGGKNK